MSERSSEAAPPQTASPIETADGSYTLHSKRYAQTYHSVHGAITEANHVYLEGSGVLDRLKLGLSGNKTSNRNSRRASEVTSKRTHIRTSSSGSSNISCNITGNRINSSSSNETTNDADEDPSTENDDPTSTKTTLAGVSTESNIRVLEVGLGLGVNALVTAAAANHYQTPVHYVGIENDFQPVSVIERVLKDFDPETVKHFCAAVKRCSQLEKDSDSDADADSTELHESNELPNTQTPAIETVSLNSYFTLQIIPFDLKEALESDAIEHNINRVGFHAIYLDAFSPDVNPECWSFDTLNKLRQTLVPGGNLATYCAKGSIRRSLLATGMNVTRRPGPPGKRECLVASA